MNSGGNVVFIARVGDEGLSAIGIYLVLEVRVGVSLTWRYEPQGT